MISASAPAIMQEQTARNADIQGAITRALDLTADTSGLTSTTGEANTDPAARLTRSTSRSNLISSSSVAADANAAKGVAGTAAEAAASMTISTTTARRSGRSRKPSSKAVANRANAEALAAAGLGLGDGEYSYREPPSPVPSPGPSSSASASSTATAGGAAASISHKQGGKKTWKKPEGKPKRPLSAYNIFFKEERARLVAEINGSADGAAHATAHDREEAERQRSEAARSHRKTHGMGFAGLAQNIAGKWKTLDGATRRPYEEKAAVDKARYVREVAAWKASLQQLPPSGAGAERQEEADFEPNRRQCPASASAPTTPRTHPVTDSSSEDETPRSRAARGKAGSKRKSPAKKAAASKHQRKSTKSAKKQRRSPAANHQRRPQHHHQQQYQQQQEVAISQHYMYPHPSAGTAADLAAFDPTAAAAQGYAPAPVSGHGLQQWDGLDQMMLGVGGAEGDLNDILSLDF